MSHANVAAFAQRRLANESLYLLLDPLADCPTDHPLHPNSIRQAFDESAFTRVLRADLAHNREACPILIRIAAPGEAPAGVLNASEAYAAEDARHEKRYVCGWLISELGLDAVAEHVVSMCRFADAGPAGFLPVFEPVRLELLAAADMALTSRRLGPVREWLLPVSSGATALLTGNDAGPTPSFSARVQEAQQEATAVVTLLSAWRSALQLNLPTAMAAWRGDTVLPPNAAAEAFRQIRQAKALGLSQPSDINTLALHRLTLHPRLHEHPTVRAFIDRAARREHPLPDLFTLIGDAQWTQIMHELMDSRTTTP